MKNIHPVPSGSPIVRVDGGEVFAVRDLHVIADRIIHPDGTPGQYVYTQRGAYGVTCIPVCRMDGVDHIAMVRQHRYPVNEFVLELPGGGADAPTAQNAARELEEETTLVAESVECLGTFFQAPGSSTTRGSAWLCRIASADRQLNYVEAESGAVTEWYTVDEVRDLMARGDIRCGITLAVLGIAFAGGRLGAATAAGELAA